MRVTPMINKAPNVHLEMVEPLEETRSEIVFATEPLSSTLQQVIPTSSHQSRNTENSAELDEIEVQSRM
jgi:SCY1-like protein 2